MDDDDDVYDLEAVEAQLARMQRQRERRRLENRLEEPRADPTMELTEAGLSSGTDSDVSGDDSSPAKPTRSAAHTKKKSRLADSLDLSMSVADLSALVAAASTSDIHEARPSKLLGAVLKHEKSSKGTSTHASPQSSVLPLPGARATSSLKPPERVQLSAFKTVGSVAPRAIRLVTDPSARAYTSERSAPERCGPNAAPVERAALVRTGLDAKSTGEEQRLAKARAGMQDKTRRLRSEPEVGSSDDEGDEHHEEDAVCAEEERLRQSLEKLDNRLTKLATAKPRVRGSSSNNSTVAAVREGYSIAGLDSDGCRTLPRYGTTAKAAQVFAASTSKRASGEIPSPVSADDDSMVTNAAYGGGAHCKRGQLTSAVERSSSTRRAEMSSGMHKLRVRTGGATAQESATLDKGSNKHKVVVKRDLAHLLF